MKLGESATAKWLRHTLPRFDVLEDVLILERNTRVLEKHLNKQGQGRKM